MGTDDAQMYMRTVMAVVLQHLCIMLSVVAPAPLLTLAPASFAYNASWPACCAFWLKPLCCSDGPTLAMA